MWHFDFSDPEGPQLGTVALAPGNAVHSCGDPVVIVTQSSLLGLSLSNNVDAEVLVLIDRSDRDFYPEKFYAAASPDGSVIIRWFDQLPSGHSVLGRVALVTIPFLPSMQKKKTGFMEEDD